MNEDMINALEARRILGVSRPMVQYLIQDGKIKPLGKFSGAYILSRKQVEELKRERETGARQWRR